MNRAATRWIQVCAALGLVLLAGPALAVGPGLGIGGDAKFHPYLDLKLGYNSNVNNLSPDANDPVTGDFLLELHPGVYVLVPTEYFLLDAGGKLGYTRYFGVEDGDTTRNVLTGEAQLKAVLNPKGSYRFAIKDRYHRTERPLDLVLARLAGRHYNVVGAEFTAEPGGRPCGSSSATTS